MMSGASKRQAAQAHETKALAIILPTIILPNAFFFLAKLR